MGGNNQPVFDPLDCSESEQKDMVRGFLDAYRKAPWPDEITSAAYEHGRRCGVNDLAGISEPWQQEIARRLVARR